jgi:outer membrane protein assembly factor BamE (lipoprotein component of BamABCDE complex)
MLTDNVRRGRWMLPVLLAVVVLVAGTFFSIVWSQRSQTRYASGFSERAFASLPDGTSSEEVLRLLGPPLQRKEISNGTTVWYYSQGLSKNFDHRALVFDSGGRVINKTAVRIVD